MTYVILVIGPSKKPFPRFLQIAGILASLLAVSKTTAEYFLFTSFNGANKDRQIPPTIIVTLKALLFFVPHAVFRTTATAFVTAFLKLYSLVPLTVYISINSVITCFLHSKHGDDNVAATFVSFALSLFTPSVDDPKKKYGRSLLKWTMLSSTIALLP